MISGRPSWTTGHTLCALLGTPPTGAQLQATIARISDVVQKLRDAAANIDPLLSVELGQVPRGNTSVLRIGVTCHHNPLRIEGVQQLVTMAPAMPPGVEVYAFSPPIPKDMLLGLGSLELPGRVVPIHQVLFTAQPSLCEPGTFDVACFVPSTAMTAMDVEGLLGALVARIVLSMGIGELRVMTRVSSVDVNVVEKAPAEAVAAWDLIEVIDNAPLH